MCRRNQRLTGSSVQIRSDAHFTGSDVENNIIFADSEIGRDTGKEIMSLFVDINFVDINEVVNVILTYDSQSAERQIVKLRERVAEALIPSGSERQIER